MSDLKHDPINGAQTGFAAPVDFQNRADIFQPMTASPLNFSLPKHNSLLY